MKKHFLVPTDAEEFQVIIECAGNSEARSYVVLVDTPSNDADVQTNIVWSLGLESFYLYSPALKAGKTVVCRPFRWVSETRSLIIEIRTWNETKDFNAIEGFKLGVRPQWNRNLVMMLQGEEA